MKCPRCQQENPPQAKFCLECGAQFTHPDQGVPPAASVTDLQRALSEALDQHAAMSEILGVISRSPADAAPVFEVIAKNACRLCDAVIANAIRFDGELMHNVAQQGFTPEAQEVMRRLFPMKPTRSSVAGRAILKGAVVYTEDASADQELLASRQFARELGFRAQVSVPMLRDGVPVGAITVARRSTGLFPERQVSLLRAFVDQAVIALENVRLFTELQEKNRALTQAHAQVSEALEQQTATSEVLKVISRSTIDVQPIFDTIVANAVRLCEGVFSLVGRLEDDLIKPVAYHNLGPTALDELRRAYPIPVDRGTIAGRALVDRAVVHVADIELDPNVPARGREVARKLGFRTVVSVPMLKEGRAIGVIVVARATPAPFTDKQIALLQTFADQAVIAIENVRLFKDLQVSNAELREALEQQTATSEILRVISGSPTDVQPVFDTIVRSATRLCRAVAAAVFVTDGQTLYEPANYGGAPEALATARARYPRPLDSETAAGTAILTRAVVHVPDLQEPSAADFVEFARRVGREIGFRSLLSVPMLHDGEAVGAINVTRPDPGPFSDTEMALLKTFADQAVIAIENVRLFRELEVANRELQAASQHKSEFLANMSHELRTPLNAIIGFSEVLSERMFGELNEKQEEYLKDINASGQHLLSLINDILDLSKVEAGRMELEVTDFHLPTALDNALTLVRERAGRRGIVLRMTTDERLDHVRADERKVRQVVLNLLSNAIKFTPEGGRIEVRAKPVDGSVEVSVTDTGVGIAPEDQEAIFEEFRQVGTADKKVEGTGLGLALSRKFVELHGGRIWVESQVGVGSTFAFTIPMRIGI